MACMVAARNVIVNDKFEFKSKFSAIDEDEKKQQSEDMIRTMGEFCLHNTNTASATKYITFLRSGIDNVTQLPPEEY